MSDLNKLTLPRFAPLVATVRSNRYRVTPVVDDTNYAWTFDEARIGYGREEITAPDYYKPSQADALIERMLKAAPASAWMNDPCNPPAEPKHTVVGGEHIEGAWERLLRVVLVGSLIVMCILLVFALTNQTSNPFVCPREHNGYPLASFKVQHNGAEYDCRYGVEEIKQ